MSRRKLNDLNCLGLFLVFNVNIENVANQFAGQGAAIGLFGGYLRCPDLFAIITFDVQKRPDNSKGEFQ
jgi:hypothetical protein